MIKQRSPLSKISKRPRKCPVCEQKYLKTRTMQPTCDTIECSLEYVKRKSVAKATAAYKPKCGGMTKEQREYRDNDRKTINEAAQREFNRWIRLVRDDGMPCQSCGKPLPKGPSTDKEAGHWKSRGAHGRLRFDESNVALECHRCNHYSDSHLLGLKESLIRRFGQAEVDRLESSGGPKKFTLDELREVRDEYKRRNKEAGVSP